jgi:hypothetical protein
MTLGTLRDELRDTSTEITALTSLKPHLDEGDDGWFDTPFGRVAATDSAMEILGGFAGAPVTFMRDASAGLRQAIMAELLSAETPVALDFSGRSSLLAAYKPDGSHIGMAPVADAAIAVLGRDATVVNRSQVRQKRLWLDAVVFDAPPGSPGVFEGGDRSVTVERGDDLSPQVGDLTRAGLSFWRANDNADLEIQLYLERLACTNGMTTRSPESEFALTGETAEEIISQLEEAARKAFSHAGEAIERFYRLRDERVSGDVTQAVVRAAGRLGLPAGETRALALRVPSILAGDRTASMFDVVNLVTNLANSPAARPAARHRLHEAGGQLAAQHLELCAACGQPT